MHSSAILQPPPLSVVFLCPCDKVYHKQEVRSLLYLDNNIKQDFITKQNKKTK